MRKHFKKIVISIMLVLTFNFITPPASHAWDFGGILIKPISSVIGAVFDVANGFITYFIVGISNGLASWTKTTVEEVTDAISDESNYSNFTDLVSTANAAGGSIFVSMEDFFLGNIDLANINIFKDISSGDQSFFTAINNTLSGTLTNVWTGAGSAILGALRVSVASWYYVLRNLSALGLLCALIFTAIRILLSSVADEKAHYKMQLVDWVKAVCLVIFVHLIMIFILNICDILIDILSSVNSKFSMLAYIRGKLFASWDTAQIGYLILYGMLTYYTLAFAISYFKRFLYTMLLIVIAPIVSLLYAFGKQGKEIFNKWLKEFIYNAMLQPYHLLIYTLLFGWVAAILEAGSNDIFVVIYACIVAHFIKDAEKYYRSLFGMGQGVAGLGQFDTGDKTIKNVQRKIVDTVKTVATTAAAVIIPGGMAVAGAKGATMTSQAMNSANTAKNLGESAGELKGINRRTNTTT